ncbi:hypothetical protein H4I74_27415 (plasmid) [Klebsiella pneumoniae]|uniref:hypothetical protein n=1 Tax=Klebsiella pneumoniae TaxID=573 RepID=UPI001A8E6143|nr:hypothetical protein [Klebsiella pneumoniae]QSS16736.1 hypothetical protein H4I74_27415 [Klebsiella pneumoniae]
MSGFELAQIALAALDSEPVAEVTGEEHRQLRDLVMMVKMLCRTVRKYNPESQQAANFTAYLQKEGSDIGSGLSARNRSAGY